MRVHLRVLRKRSFRVLLLAGVLIFTTTLLGCGNTEQVVSPIEVTLNKVIEEYGGTENLKKLNSHKLIWDIDAVSRGDRGRDIRFVVLPSKLRVELKYTNSTESRIIDGEAGARGSSLIPLSLVSGPPLDAMKLQRMRLYTPLTLLAKKNELTMSEVDSYKVLTINEGTLVGNYYINTSTNRIDKFVGAMPLPGAPGKAKMEFLTEYSDFNVVEGVLLASREVKYAGGVNTAIMTLLAYKFAAQFDEEFFALPTAAAN